MRTRDPDWLGRKQLSTAAEMRRAAGLQGIKAVRNFSIILKKKRGARRLPPGRTMTVLRKLEDDFGSELYVATFLRTVIRPTCGKNVAAANHAADIRTARVNIQVRVIEQVEYLGTKLNAHPLGEVNLFEESRRGVPATRAAEGVPRAHTRRERTEVVVRDEPVAASWNPQRLFAQINEPERIGVSSIRLIAIDCNRS